MEPRELLKTLEASVEAHDALTQSTIAALKEHIESSREAETLQARYLDQQAAMTAVIVETAFILKESRARDFRRKHLTRMGLLPQDLAGAS